MQNEIQTRKRRRKTFGIYVGTVKQGKRANMKGIKNGRMKGWQEKGKHVKETDGK